MKLLVGLCSVVCVAISCAPVYIPNTVHTPQLTYEGEFAGAATAGLSGFDVQAAYAVSNNFGVMVNTSFDPGDTSDTDYHEHAFGEVGLGYLTDVGENGSFNFFAGYGMGSSASGDDFYLIIKESEYARGMYYRIFAQMDIGFKTRVFEGGVALRSSYVDFYRIMDNKNKYAYSEDNLFMEPAVYLRLGAPSVKFHTQLGFSTPVFSDYSFDHLPFILNVGLTFRFPTTTIAGN